MVEQEQLLLVGRNVANSIIISLVNNVGSVFLVINLIDQGSTVEWKHSDDINYCTS